MDDAILQEAAELYGAGSADCTPLAGGHAGSAYRFLLQGEPCVLRIAAARRDLDAPSARAIAAWMLHVADDNGPAARPVVSMRGCLVETLNRDSNDLVITAVKEAPGVLGEKLPAEAWNRRLCRRLGGAVGKLHHISSSYVPPPDVPRRPDWDSVGSCFNPPSLAGYDGTVIGDRRAEVLRAIEDLPRDADSYGLIHGDLHSANFCVAGDSGPITFFDFDDCCYGWYAMDIAMSLFDAVVLYGEAGASGFVREFVDGYLSGYLEKRYLEPFWAKQLPHFLKLLEIDVYTQVARAYERGTDDEWIQKFMPGRRDRIVNEVPFVDLPFAELAEAIAGLRPGDHREAG